jgi:acyl-CoA synthetase (NDP forming)
MNESVRDLAVLRAFGIAVVGAGERATSLGGVIMQLLRQAGYGGRVVPVNPKGGAIFGYESVTSIAVKGQRPRPAAQLGCLGRQRDASRRRGLSCLAGQAAPVIPRLAEMARGARLPVPHSMMGTLPAKTDWFATMERAGVPMFDDVEEMAEAAGLLARYPALCDAAHKDLPFSATIRNRTRR